MPATPRGSPLSHTLPVILKKPKDVDLLVGETAEFEIIVADQPGISVSWSKDGQPLFATGRTKIWNKANNFFMRITNVDMNDESLYEVRVHNEYAEITCDVQLLVNGKWKQNVFEKDIYR